VIQKIPLPISPTGGFTIQADLDGVTFTLDIIWNSRDGYWYLSIETPNGTPILAGQKAVVSYPIGWHQYYNPAMPTGNLQWIDTTGQGLDPGYADIGARVLLYYFDAAEVAAQIAGTGTNVPG
jgi:hypothetical protein